MSKVALRNSINNFIFIADLGDIGASSAWYVTISA